MKNREIKNAVRYFQTKGILYAKQHHRASRIYLKLVNGEKIDIYLVADDDVKYGASSLKRRMPNLMIYDDKIFSHRDVVMVGMERTNIELKGDD